MSNSIIHLHESMRGAPVVKGAAGSRILALDAVLVNGWGEVTLTSLVISAGTATATVPTGQTFEVGKRITLNAPGGSGINGDYAVLTSTNTEITFSVPGADTTVTGVNTVKYASAGWSKVFASTNNAVYRANKVGGANRFLQIVDNAAAYARVYAYNNMTTISAGTGNFGSGYYWHSSDVARNEPCRYDLIADDRFIHALWQPMYNYGGMGDRYKGGYPRCFGELNSLYPGGDMWNSTLCGAMTDNFAAVDGNYASAGISDGVKTERNYGGVGGANSPYIRNFATSNGLSGSDPRFGLFSESPGGKLILSAPYITHSSTEYAPRAIFPGVYYIPQRLTYVTIPYQPRDTLILPNGHEGAIFYTGGYSINGMFIVDTEGPW